MGFKIMKFIVNDIAATPNAGGGYSTQEKRVFGYISELLMDVWLETNTFRYTELNWGQLGGKKNIKKAIYLIKRKIGIKTNTHF